MTSDSRAVASPVIVSVTQSSDRDGERLPNGVQIVLDHLGLVADGEPGNTEETAQRLNASWGRRGGRDSSLRVN